jgi:FlaG/FlaF family flagellin (archaellin)
MHMTRLSLIAILAITAILAGIVITNVLGQTVLFTHTFPKTPKGI